MNSEKLSNTVLSALGHLAEQPANVYLRTQLMLEIKSELTTRKMTQIEAATTFGVSQPRVSDLLCGRLNKFTLDTLINWLSKLGRRVELVVSDGDGSASVPKRL